MCRDGMGTGMGDCASSTSSWSNNDGFDFVSSFTYYLYIAIICALLSLSFSVSLSLSLSFTHLYSESIFLFFFSVQIVFRFQRFDNFQSELELSMFSLSLSLCLLFPSLSSSFFLPFLALCFPLYSALTWHCFVQLSCHLTLMTRHNPSTVFVFFWQL